jgi:hypothetical protein
MIAALFPVPPLAGSPRSMSSVFAPDFCRW